MGIGVNTTMNRLIKGAAFAFALLLLTAPANADPYLDFVSEPTGSSTTAEFVGDWASKTGFLNFEDIEVTGLIYLDGSQAPPKTDTVIGAGVDLKAYFVDGRLDTTKSNTFEISKGTDVFYKADLYFGSIVEFGFVFDFASAIGTDGSNPVVNDTAAGNESDWIAENEIALLSSGANIAFFGVLGGSAGLGPNGVTNLTNIYGKPTPTPEPGTFVLFGAAAIGFVLYRRRKSA